MQNGKIKVLTEGQNILEVIKKVKTFEGVVDVTLENGVITYYLDEWASDYDVMISIMNALEEVGVDSEPCFDGEEETNEVHHDHDHEHDHEHDHDGEHCCCHDHEHDDGDDHCCCHDHDHDHDDDECECCGGHIHVDEHSNEGGCCCCNTKKNYEPNFFKAKKVKIIELSIALVVLIVGIILEGITSTSKIAPYVQILAYTIAGYEVLFDALIGITKKRFFNEQLLIILASFAAIVLGETIEAVGIMILYNVGTLFEAGAVNNSLKALDALRKSIPEKVTILDENGVEISIKPAKVKVGSILVLKAGDKIAIDGVIIEGKTNLDTKTTTGESVYTVGEEGTEVLGGYIVVDGAIKVKTTKTYRDSAVSKIVDIVSTASDDKSKAEKFISTFAKYYTPVVVITAILLAFIPPFFYETYAEGFEIWLKRGVMMLCVSCPCALVVSVPLSYFCSVGYLAKNGVLVKTTERLSSLGKCTTFAFDKTGTLTTGEFEVTKIVSTKKFQGKVLEICAICEKNSNHPLAKSILKKYGKEITVNAENLVEIAGRGIACEINGDKVLCGNAKFLLENNVEFKSVEEIGVKIYLAVNGEYAGTVILNDVARDTAYGAIMELYDEGVTNTVLLTGDNKEYARVIRKQLNMRQSVSELLPENKVEEIERLMENGEKTVAFVGDGINDAPVLSRADVGIAMGGLGSDLAVESADVVIVDDDLSKVPFALKVAKRANNIAKQNIVASIAIKVLIMLLSIFGVTSSIWLAIVGDVGVLILAILNSLRSSLKIL